MFLKGKLPETVQSVFCPLHLLSEKCKKKIILGREQRDVKNYNNNYLSISSNSFLGLFRPNLQGKSSGNEVVILFCERTQLLNLVSR